MTFEDFWEQMGWQDSGYKNNFKSCWNACAQEYKAKIKEALDIMGDLDPKDEYCYKGMDALRYLIKE